MRGLEDVECSQKALRYMSKAAAPSPSAAERRSGAGQQGTAVGVEDDGEDLIARMRRLYGVSVSGEREAAPAVTGSNIRVIARRTDVTPEPSPPRRTATAHYNHDDEMDDLSAARRMLAGKAPLPVAPPDMASGKYDDSEGAVRRAPGSKDPTRDLRDVSAGPSDAVAHAKGESKVVAPSAAAAASAKEIRNAADYKSSSTGRHGQSRPLAHSTAYDSEEDSGSGEDNDDDDRGCGVRRKAVGGITGREGPPAESRVHGTRRRTSGLDDKPWRANSTLVHHEKGDTAGRRHGTSTRQVDHPDGDDDDDSDQPRHGESLAKGQTAGHLAGKRGLTVPKSPQFSKMSWQRRRRGEPNGPPPAIPASSGAAQYQQQLKTKKSEDQLGMGGAGAGRTASAPRGKKASGRDDVLSGQRGVGGRDNRSVSSGRMGASRSRTGLH